jgi:malate dehydrogenase (oxaloacetate-decarboxylating)
MLDFKITVDPKTGHRYLETDMEGKTLLSVPQLNKGTAFTFEERLSFGLLGKLPSRIETLSEQVTRVYIQCQGYETALQKNIYLNNLHDKNQIVFYKLLSENLEELLPIIYTPTISEAVSNFSHKFRQSRGIYFSYPEQEHLDDIIDNRSNPEIDIVCITDGESVLGIGDQGIGGMEIPIAKLMVYSLCGGINPSRMLPVMIDLGTNNPTLLENPNYLGWKQHRLQGEAYHQFVDRVVHTIRKKLPNAFIHWEDFGAVNARAILERYKTEFCTFNDDIEGTGVTALAAIMAAGSALNMPLPEQKVVIFGAGAAGTGIANQIADGMIFAGATPEQAYQQIWLIDRHGLICELNQEIDPSHLKYARTITELNTWGLASNKELSLLDVITHVKPTVLIGSSAVAGAFSEAVVRTMAQQVARPIIMPLSNPTNRAEAIPEDLIGWTDGKALIATGSPFAPVKYSGKTITIAQCNNARVFPGVGLGVIAAKPKYLSNAMLLAAAVALSECAPVLTDIYAPILPGVSESKRIAKKIAFAVGKQAHKEGITNLTLNELERKIDEIYWEPEYLPYLKAK